MLLLVDASGGRGPEDEAPKRRRRRPELRPLLPLVAPAAALVGAATQTGAVGAGFALGALALLVRALARWVDGFGLKEFRQ